MAQTRITAKYTSCTTNYNIIIHNFDESSPLGGHHISSIDMPETLQVANNIKKKHGRTYIVVIVMREASLASDVNCCVCAYVKSQTNDGKF
jgi:hypothetical protein